MTNPIKYPIACKVGIQRDGTEYDSDQYVSGSWTRFYKDRAQKIGGYKTISDGNATIIRNIFSVNSTNSIILYIGRSTGLSYITVNPDLTASAEISITPIDFVPNDNITWSFATVTYNDVEYILALPAPNGNDISSSTLGTLYFGVVGNASAVTAVINTVDDEPIQASGGVVVTGNYIMVYGSGGSIQWNDGGGTAEVPTGLTTWPIDFESTAQTSKFVYAAPVKSGQTLSALFWSLDFVSLMTLNQDTPPTFQQSYASTESTLLSANAIVSSDPYFYWPGNNSFYQFNGAVIPYPNEINKEWFFDNVNREYKEKVYGFVNRIYNEVWFLFPYGTATENTNACISILEREGAWYDTDEIPRSCAIPSSTEFPYPIMCSSVAVNNGTNNIYPIWAHEYGVDKVQLGQRIAINANFQTNWVSADIIDPSLSMVIIDSVIPDIKQTGNMSLVISTKAYPNSTATLTEPFLLTPQTEFLTIQEKSSIFSTTFTSSEVGGYFLMGNTKLVLKPCSDERPGPASS